MDQTESKGMDLILFTPLIPTSLSLSELCELWGVEEQKGKRFWK